MDNLALACLHCNKHKGPNIAGRNPETGEIVELFHPRRDLWVEHFGWHGADLIGKTAVGHVTIQVLRVNDPPFRAVRIALQDEGFSNFD